MIGLLVRQLVVFILVQKGPTQTGRTSLFTTWVAAQATSPDRETLWSRASTADDGGTHSAYVVTCVLTDEVVRAMDGAESPGQLRRWIRREDASGTGRGTAMRPTALPKGDECIQGPCGTQISPITAASRISRLLCHDHRSPVDLPPRHGFGEVTSPVSRSQ